MEDGIRTIVARAFRAVELRYCRRVRVLHITPRDLRLLVLDLGLPRKMPETIWYAAVALQERGRPWCE